VCIQVISGKRQKKISNFDLFKVAIKSFFVQSSWNFERMQALGFAHCLSKILRNLYNDQLLLKNSLLRHLEFFNTNPYLAPTILGVVLNWEEKQSRTKDKGIDSSSIKAKLMGPFGAIGDSLFWATFRPLAAIIGTLLAFIGIKAAPIYFLIIYNIPAITIRFYGLFKGYCLGPMIVDEIKKLNLNLYMKKMKEFSCFLLGFLLGIYALSPSFRFDRINFPTNIIFSLILMCIFLLMLEKKISPVLLIYLLAVACVGLKYIS